MKLTKKSLIGSLILILSVSVIISHFLPPMGVFAIPITISLMTALIAFTDHFSILPKSLFAYLFIGLNDIGIKVYAGGQHDLGGIGIIHTFLCIGLIPSFIMLLIAAFGENRAPNWAKIFSLLIFILLIYVHLELFELVGTDSELIKYG
jgi:hypothetical protein